MVARRGTAVAIALGVSGLLGVERAAAHGIEVLYYALPVVAVDVGFEAYSLGSFATDRRSAWVLYPQAVITTPQAIGIGPPLQSYS